jgi:heat shock protein HtpX
MLRVLLFLGTNFAVLMLLGVVMTVLEQGFGVRLGNTTQLLVFAALFGFGGSFISLALSKFIAKRSTGAQVIDAPANATEQWLVDTVRRQAQAAGIGMPEVAIFPSPEMNAFATGMNRNKALVAVSVGLLQGMQRHEIEAVLAHEISHVANGDMVTMSLLQGVLNTFVIFFARIIGSLIDGAIRGNRGESGGRGVFYYVIVMVLEIALGIVASLIVAWFSRRREFRADAGGAALEGRDSMIGALMRLRAGHDNDLPASIKAFGIAGPIGKLLATHPPIPERIAALQAAPPGGGRG